nr:MAG TPA: hypothetical protein [Caudoviricetes sp.]
MKINSSFLYLYFYNFYYILFITEIFKMSIKS